MPHILIASHHPTLTTGYGRVTRTFARALARAGHDVSFVALGRPDGWQSFEGCQVLAAVLSADGLVPSIVQAAADFAFDMVMTIGDPWMFEGLDGFLLRSAALWLACFPLDGGPIPRQWLKWIAAADERMVFSRYAQSLVEQATGRVPPVLHHGVDTAVFAPGDRSLAKQQVVGDAQAFVVGCVAANQQRKNLPALMGAFADFAGDKPEAVLYLHTPVAGYWDLEELADHIGITQKVRATLSLHPQIGVTDATLALIYNSFDIFALPTMGEGFGLPLLEAQSCGVAAVATDCTACSELLVEPMQRIRVESTLFMARNVEQAIIDRSDLTQKLNLLYADAPLRERLGRRGRELAVSMDWAKIQAKLIVIVDQTLAAR